MLLAYNGDSLDKKFLCLWNPATGEYKEIPKSPINKCNGFSDSICASALGYDHKTNDYKLALAHLETQGSMDSTLFQIYSLASNSWRTWQIVPYRFDHDTAGVLVNGDLHWLARAQGKYLVLSLDFSDESFKELQLAKEILEKGDDYPSMIILQVLEGCLCILIDSYVNGVKIHVEVWEMLDYGVVESWTRRYIITHESIIEKHIHSCLIWSFENGKIVFLTADNLVLYDPEHGSAKELNMDSTGITYYKNYFESLISLKSGTYVGGEGRVEEIRET